MAANFPVTDNSIRPPVVNRQVGIRGLPVVSGTSQYKSVAQMRGNRIVVRGCYGNFDTADITQEHFGRTLHQVYASAAIGEYIIHHQSHAWIGGDGNSMPRIMVFVQWSEYTERDAVAVSQLYNGE